VIVCFRWLWKSFRFFDTTLATLLFNVFSALARKRTSSYYSLYLWS